MRYRRANAKGGTYFFTVNLAERHRALLIEYIDVLRSAVKTVKQAHPFYIDAFVVLPDHLHAIWTLPEDDTDFATRWMLIKAGFSRHIPAGEKRSASRISKGERGTWQRRYWEHQVRDEGDYSQYVAYIHYNPVKHGHVKRASDWQYSSIHRYINAKIIKKDWAANTELSTNDRYGER